MSHQVTVELSDGAFAALEVEASTAAQPIEQVAAAALELRFAKEVEQPSESEKAAAIERFERHFGSVDLGHATGADNESIDADLAREYDATLREV